MRLVATEYLSLDGVFDEPGHWSGPYFDDEAGAFKFEELQAGEALLLGRRTYEGFAAAWPSMEAETGEFGVRMNTMPKYVVSSTLTAPEWAGTEVLTGDLATAVGELRDRPGGDLLLAGSGQLFRGLAELGLIDVYRFMVHPVVLGSGASLFAGGTVPLTMRRTGVRTFGGGIVVLEYEPVRS